MKKTFGATKGMSRRGNSPVSMNIMDYVDSSEDGSEEGEVVVLGDAKVLPPILLRRTSEHTEQNNTELLHRRRVKLSGFTDFIPKEDHPNYSFTIDEKNEKETTWEFIRGSFCFAIFVAIVTIFVLGTVSYIAGLLYGEGPDTGDAFGQANGLDMSHERGSGLLGGRSGLLNMDGVLNFHLIQFFKQHRRRPEQAHILIIGGTPYDFLMEIVNSQAILWDDSVIFRVEYKGLMLPERRRRELQTSADMREILENRSAQLQKDGPEAFEGYNQTVKRALSTLCNGIQKVEDEFIEALYNNTSAPNIRTNIAIGMTDVIFHEALCSNPLSVEEEVHRVGGEIVRYFTADKDFLTIHNTVDRETSLYDIVIVYAEMFRVATEENTIRTTLQRLSHLVPMHKKEMAQVAPAPSIVFADVISHGRKHRELLERAACAVALSPQSFVHMPYYQSKVQQLNHRCAKKRFGFLGARQSPGEKRLCSIANDLAEGSRVSMMITVARDNMQNTMHVCSGHTDILSGKRDEL